MFPFFPAEEMSRVRRTRERLIVMSDNDIYGVDNDGSRGELWTFLRV